MTNRIIWVLAVLISVMGIFVRGPWTVCLGNENAVPSLVFSDNGTPPEAVEEGSGMPEPERAVRAPAQTLPAVDPQNREASRSFYNNYYAASSAAEGRNTGWTGSYGSCSPGTTASGFQNAVLTRVNYFRAMAGVPSTVSFYSTYSAKAQQAALIMSVNRSLSHSPPTSWSCYTAEGAEAANKSNLHIHYGSYLDPITGYIQDSGSGNAVVGHRRWVLYPQTEYMGTGDVPEGSGNWAANALWVQDSNIWGTRPATRESYVAWPPPGYVPYQVVFARWSFSIKNADFSGATVSMTQNGSAISVAIDARISNAGAVPENAIVWRPFGLASDYVWPKPPSDTTYEVAINNVIVGGVPRNYSYTVKVFDPASGGGLWSGASDVGGGWKYLSWFGYFAVNGNWIYHNEHGWMYVIASTTADMNLWNGNTIGWWWTSQSSYPDMYNYTAAGWFWYYKGSKNPRYFWNYRTNRKEQTYD